ncbi:choice-of-anchor B family protein [Flavobacteriaceae bacterium]|jgi:choice-of-anchor B domain-containing protein|nr:choice-of-anchor B family protein [Flavobacteriaceae bacterium]MDC1336605.1 choice-of-anchor B family protein [Flavobacteriaceae bacterium]|tara:strand:- start:9066 stop:10364 length:1299 start_codon:yes stop_codon:yes gene_type:complete
MKNYILILCLVLVSSCQYEDYDDSKVIDSPLATCIDGFAKIPGTDYEYSCLNYDLMGRITLEEMDAEAGNDCWGWTDSTTGREYAIMGVNNGTSFIDITDSTSPIYLGKLPTATVDSSWRDMKVYNDHVYIVSEAGDHGLQVFNLANLRGIDSEQVFSADYTDKSFGQAHNIAINEDSGYAYIAGARTKGIYALNLSNPLAPKLELEGSQFGYSHDAQIVNYKGPDQDYFGKEIYIGSNENKVDIVDVTDKSEPKLISTFLYDHQYTHQAWLTDDHKYALLGDELDEVDSNYELKADAKTRTVIIDLSDLDKPELHHDYEAETKAIDHNGYVKGTEFFLASYTAGLRVLDILNIDQKSISEIGFFNTFIDHNDSGLPNSTTVKSQDPDGDHSGKKGNSEAFNGAWSVYPFFKSENIIISDINSGLFIVKKQN